MPFSREQACGALAGWNPAPVFLDAYTTRHLPENLQIYFGPPEEFFLAPDTQAIYTNEQLIPILDDGNFGLITFHDPGKHRLIQQNVEAPNAIRATFTDWQQYLADLMLRIGESDDDDDRIQRIIDIVQFRHAEDLIELWRRSGELDYRDYDDACRDFVSSIRGT